MKQTAPTTASPPPDRTTRSKARKEQERPATETPPEEAPEGRDDVEKATAHRDIPANPTDTTDEEETKQAEDYGIELNFWNGDLPIPAGPVAEAIDNKNTIGEQQHLVQLCRDRIDNGTWTTDTLQQSSRLVTFIGGIPGKMRKVRVFYAIGCTDLLDQISDESKTAGKTMAMFGECIDGRAYPPVATLTKNAFARQKYKVPAFEQFEDERLKIDASKMSKRFFISSSKVNTFAELPKLVPVPAYLVYDGIARDIDAVLLYERLVCAANDEECYCREALKEAMQFLRAFLTSTNNKDKDISLALESIIAPPTPDSILWRDMRMHQTFPHLVFDAAAPMATPTTPTPRDEDPATAALPPRATTAPPSRPPPPEVPPSTPRTIQMTEESLFRMFDRFQQHRRTTRGLTADDDDNDDNSTTANTATDNKLGLDDLVYSKLLTMCGLTLSEREEVPKFWSQLRRKSLSKNDRADIIRAVFSDNLHYRGRRIPLLPSLIHMFRDRTFEGDGTSASLTSATKGLSPFAVPSLSEVEVEAFIDHASALASATSTSLADVTEKTLKAKAPDSFQGCIMQLQTFGNVLVNGFGEMCPLFLALDRLIAEMEECSDLERRAYSKQSYAAILWIVMKQSRVFAAGKMSSPTTVIPAFEVMLNNIITRMPISHGAVPPQLYASTTPTTGGQHNGTGNGSKGSNGGGIKRDREDKLAGREDEHKQRRTKFGEILRPYQAERSDIFHPKMREAMAAFNQLKRKPTVRQLCIAAGASATQLFPAFPSICVRAQLYGACDKKCQHQHTKLPDKAIEDAIKVLQPAISNPSKVTKV